jgi:hypothetical protein
LFATLAIEAKTKSGNKEKESFGIRQGSGKTALAFYQCFLFERLLSESKTSLRNSIS